MWQLLQGALRLLYFRQHIFDLEKHTRVKAYKKHIFSAEHTAETCDTSHSQLI